MRIWSDASQCLCFRQNQNFVRNARKGWSFKRNHVRYTSDRANTQSSSDGITRRLTFVEDKDSDQQCDSTRISEMEGSIHETHCNLKVSSFKKRQTYNSETNKLHKMTYISSGGEFSEDDDDDDDDDDDAEMLTPDEWPDVFIQGWSSPLPSRPKERTRMLQTPVTDSSQYQIGMQSSTPPQAWHKITGSYSPLSHQRLERKILMKL
ncbi:uncharacterized protein LOC110833288 isoform X3 [Zootermopsis nevadensis]|uniref:uncharacterized protein LOC110833288 isoform X3 n=1 Tax=Zootermopsis nevadensis TaxID=136037 RepID=UPI000B8E6285|nr:uncharacterized protein LOC110833288 isoform X3 [Zootermopsis nevadensis]